MLGVDVKSGVELIPEQATLTSTLTTSEMASVASNYLCTMALCQVTPYMTWQFRCRSYTFPYIPLQLY